MTESSADRAIREMKLDIAQSSVLGERAFRGFKLGLDPTALEGIRSVGAQLTASAMSQNFLGDDFPTRLTSLLATQHVLNDDAAARIGAGFRQALEGQFRGYPDVQPVLAEQIGAIAHAAQQAISNSTFTASATALAAYQAQTRAFEGPEDLRIEKLQYELGRLAARQARLGLSGATASLSRLNLLQAGYAQQTGGPADAFGRLDTAVRSMTPLADAVDDVMRAARVRSGFGFDYEGVKDALLEVDEVLDDPEVERAILEPVAEVQDLADLHDDVLALPDVLGVVRRARQLRVSTLGLICGFTIGSTYVVFSYVGGDPLPVAGLDGVMAGAWVYDGLRRREAPRVR